MYRKWLTAFILVFLLLGQISMVNANSTQEAPLTRIDNNPPPEETETGGLIGIQSYGSGDRIGETDEEFVTDSYSSLDRYTFRSGSPIRFPILIERYFGPVDGNGLLLHPENIEGQKALLTFRVWDVDQNYSGPYAPEVDDVSFNGQKVGVLTGADGQWSTFSVEIPVSQIKFPTYNQQSGVTPAENWVEIQIDQANIGVCECWAVTVDWGRLVVKGIRPAVLIHGFMSSASTWDTWVNSYARNAGLPVYAFSFADNHGSWFDHAQEAAGRIAQAKQMFGVEQLNIVGHSKGGLDSRAYLANGGTDVKRLVMLGTPNGGSPLADIVKAGGILNTAVGLVSLIGEPALTELTVTYMQLIGNRVVGPNLNTRYYTVAGDWRWNGFSNPLIWGPDDGVVAVSSVETLPYTASLGRTSSFHTAMTANAAEWSLASQQVVTTAQAWPVGEPLAFTGAGLDGGTGLINISSLTGHEITAGTTSHAVAVEAGAPATLGILWGSGELSLTLTSPSGEQIIGQGNGVELVSGTDESLGLRYILYRLTAPEAGVYQLNLSSAGSTPVRYLAVGAGEGGPSLTASARNSFVTAGSPLTLEAVLDWGGASPEPMTVAAHVERPGGAVDVVPLTDAGNGLYTVEYTPAASGYYSVAVVAQGGTSRIAVTSFQALSGDTRFTGAYSHKGIDQNNDSLYDLLSVQAGVNVAAGGEYMVMAQLTGSDGPSLVRASVNVSLPAGSSTVTLPFDGLTLGQSGFSGDLTLTDLALIGAHGVIHDFVSPAATLSGYNARQFQRSPMQVLPGTTDTAVDLNGDGKYDQLRIQIPVEVLLSGYYDVNARLMDSRGQEIDWQGITVYLQAGSSTVTLAYNGETIGRHGVNGPYYVRDFSFYARSGSGRTVNIYEFYTTQAYAVNQFTGYTTPRPTFDSVLAKIDQFHAAGKIATDGLAQSLRSKVENARAAWERSNHTAAEKLLGAFIQELSAQEGKGIEAAAAQELAADANLLIEDLQS